MFPFTHSIIFVWQIAAIEAISQDHEFLEKEHVFCALCKAHELLQEDILEQLGVKGVSLEAIRKELFPVQSAFNATCTDPKHLRRKLRILIGQGDYERRKGEVIHRSRECKRCFESAAGLAKAEGSGLLSPVHLFTALLLEPTPHIERVLMELGTTSKDLLEALHSGKGPHKSRSYLERIGRDLVSLAKKRELKPLIGRQAELLQIIRTLLRRDKNNPVLVGDAGVGKTAIVKGLAQRISDRNIDKSLWGVQIIEINLSFLLAGAKYRGEFEERLLRVIEEARARPEVILFIDEIHTVAEASRATGSLNASDIMKPFLVRGDLRVIGATTTDEYRRYIEKDPALERRFQPIMVDEPCREDTLEILNGLKVIYESHHGVSIDQEAISAILDLSIQYLPYRRLPDKAIDLMDKACAAVRVSTVSISNSSEPEEPSIYQEDTGPVPQRPVVTPDVVAQLVREETGIPVARANAHDRDMLLGLSEVLKDQIVGQDEAVEKVCQAVRLSHVGLKDAGRPLCVFLFLGPTGVGKTGLAKALARGLFGSANCVIRLDMSEYMESHSVARLIGSPPGYVGHEEGGQLTEGLKRKPYSVVLLDEIEKAHPRVLDVFLQVFDEGRLTDGKGGTVDATNAIFIMTSNLGALVYHKEPMGFVGPDSQEYTNVVNEDIEARLRNTLHPEFLSRIDETVLFRPLDIEALVLIAGKMFESLKKKMASERKIFLGVEAGVLELLAEKVHNEPLEGARHMKRLIRQMVEVPLSERIIKGEINQWDRVVIRRTSGDELVIGLDYRTE